MGLTFFHTYLLLLENIEFKDPLWNKIIHFPTLPENILCDNFHKILVGSDNKDDVLYSTGGQTSWPQWKHFVNFMLLQISWCCTVWLLWLCKIYTRLISRPQMPVDWLSVHTTSALSVCLNCNTLLSKRLNKNIKERKTELKINNDIP